jgi:hypothetical protein
MNQLLHHAMEAEAQLAEEVQQKYHFSPASRYSARAPSNPAPAPHEGTASFPSFSTRPVPSGALSRHPATTPADSSSSSASVTRASEKVCHTCGGKGHFKIDCPNNKVIVVIENGYETGDDADPFGYEDECEDAYANSCHIIVVSPCMLSVQPSVDSQRCNLFQSKALVGPNKACKVIIDGGSYRNLASKELCAKLGLKYLPHPNPYYIQWVSDNGEMKVNHMVLLNFEIGPYKDSIDFDVVPMTVCHLLLGRPWLYDRHVQYNGRANTYHLEFKGMKINLLPMSPQQIGNESREKGEVKLEQPLPQDNVTAVSDITKSERVPKLLVLATKEDMGEFSEDPTVMPLVLMYKGEVLVSNHMQPVSLRVSIVLQEFDDIFPVDVPDGLPLL